MTPSINCLEAYTETKDELESSYLDKIKGSLVRSRAEFMENNEKNAKYFSDLEKRNFNMKCIKCLQIDNKTATAESEILLEQKKFYEQLYNDNEK